MVIANMSLFFLTALMVWLMFEARAALGIWDELPTLEANVDRTAAG